MSARRRGVSFTRRALLHGAGTALIATPLVGCGRTKSPGADAGGDADAAYGGDADAAYGGDADAAYSGDTDTGGDADAGHGGNADAADAGDTDAATVDATSESATDGLAETEVEAGPPWATGGTAGMKDKASYPNPFAGPVGARCVLTCASTIGPCYSAQVEELQDISYGHLGLPTRLYFQVLDESCTPIPGASVDVWHTSPAGKYSGNDPVNEDVPFCTGDDADHKAHLYFRGKQTADAKGVVFFDSCFPGWYPGRSVHIHFTIRIGGNEQATGQVFFDDALNDDILGTQPLYNDRGMRDTLNLIDSIAFTQTLDRYTMQTKKMTDGALLAWKALVIRPSTPTKDLCFLPYRDNP